MQIYRIDWLRDAWGGLIKREYIQAASASAAKEYADRQGTSAYIEIIRVKS